MVFSIKFILIQSKMVFSIKSLESAFFNYLRFSYLPYDFETMTGNILKNKTGFFYGFKRIYRSVADFEPRRSMGKIEKIIGMTVEQRTDAYRRLSGLQMEAKKTLLFAGSVRIQSDKGSMHIPTSKA